MALNSAELSAVSALAGTAIGGITQFISNNVVQRSLTQREMASRELAERLTLYAEFIRFGATVYTEASTSNLDKLDDLVFLHALVGRIRLLGSEPVIQAAEDFTYLVTKRYGEKKLSLEDMREVTSQPHLNPLQDFSMRCREEIRHLLRFGIN